MSRITSFIDYILNVAASLKGAGIHLVRIAIFIIFVWIGGLKFWNYEAEGIVPFVANSPFMNFFYTKNAPEYKDYKLKEGEFDKAKHEWHEANNTYTFSHGFPLLTGAGRLVIKDVCILASAVVVLADCAQRILRKKQG